MTRQAFGSRDGLTRYVVTSTTDFDLTAVDELMKEAWAFDYADRIRMDFDTAHLEHMMNGSAWYAVMVCTDDERPVGFELALQRTLFCRGERLDAYLVSAFTVSSQQRRRGIGRWLLEGINAVAFEQRNADLLFSSFHHGAAGSPTVQSTFDQIEGFAVNRFFSFPSWGRRIDKEPLPPIETPLSVHTLQLTDVGADWQIRTASDSTASASLPSLESFTKTVRNGYDVSFGLDKSFRDFYLQADDAEAGALWYEFGDEATCLVTYAVIPLIVNERALSPTGLIQAVHASNCRPDHLEQLLVDLAHRFLAQGCFAMSLYDVGVFPHPVLERLGLKSDDRYDYAVRGPRSVTDRFANVKPPFFLDFM